MAGLPAEARIEGAREREGGSNSVVESQPSKLLVAGSIPVSRSIRLRAIWFGHALRRMPAIARSAAAGNRKCEIRLASRLDPRLSAEARSAKAEASVGKPAGPALVRRSAKREGGSFGSASQLSGGGCRAEAAGAAQADANDARQRTRGPKWADVAQLAERVLGKDEVTSSILVIGSRLRSPRFLASFGSRATRPRLSAVA